MTLWLLNINCLFFVNLFVRSFFIMEVFKLLVMRVLIEQPIKKKSKQIFEHFIWTYSQFHPEIMWEQWETVTCSFLPSLSIFGILLLKTSVTSSSLPFVPISSLSKRPFGTWSLMTWQCSSVKLIPLLQNKKCHHLNWLPSPITVPHFLTAGALGQNLCVYFSVWLKSCSTLPGVS